MADALQLDDALTVETSVNPGTIDGDSETHGPATLEEGSLAEDSTTAGNQTPAGVGQGGNGSGVGSLLTPMSADPDTVSRTC